LSVSVKASACALFLPFDVQELNEPQQMADGTKKLPLMEKFFTGPTHLSLMPTNCGICVCDPTMMQIKIFGFDGS